MKIENDRVEILGEIEAYADKVAAAGPDASCEVAAAHETGNPEDSSV